MKQEHIARDIDMLWVDRPSIDSEWALCEHSPSGLLIVGPPRSGKHSYTISQHLKLSKARPISGRQVNQRDSKWQEFREDSRSMVSIIINLPDYRPIRNIIELYSNLQVDIVRLVALELGFDEKELMKDVGRGASANVWAAGGLLRVLGNLLNADKRYRYHGSILIFLCGLQHIYEFSRGQFFHHLRRFLDDAVDYADLYRLRIILTSVLDPHFLSTSESDLCSPLNCLRRITMKDPNRREFDRLMALGKQSAGVTFEDADWLFDRTCGDFYLTKVIMSICRSNLIQSPEETYVKRPPVSNKLIDGAIDAITNIRRGQCLPTLGVLFDYIETHGEVRDVLYALWRGAKSVEMVDTKGVFTIPESSGAVRKLFKNGKYVYVFRNAIYEQVVDKYFRAEGQKIDGVLATAMGKAEIPFGTILASAIRHELGTPAVLIDATLSALRELPKKSPMVKRALINLIRAGKSLSLTSSVLDNMRGQYGRPVGVDLNGFLEQIVSLFHGHFDPRQISLQVEFDSTINTIRLDPSAMEICLIQLIINAHDAVMEKGKGTIVVGTFVKDARRFIVFVRDDGRGMDRNTLGKATKAGFSTKIGHSGLGFSLVRAAAERMGGEIGIESKKGKGTTVSILLPRN